MSEQQKKLDGPDFAQGVPFGDLGEGSMILGHVAGRRWCWREPVERCSRSAPRQHRFPSASGSLPTEPLDSA
jgi:hypothetical protein